jgi:hypothetical protein
MIINQIHKKIVKEGSGDLSDLGAVVKVQATDNFSVGDTFVGTAVSGMTPKPVRVKSGFPDVGQISADGSVGIKNGALSSASTTVTIYIKNEDAYTEVVVPLPDMTGATSCQVSYTYKTVSINENGTIIIANMKAFLLKISVAKESLTATAERIEPSSVSLAKYPYNDAYPMTPVDFTAGNVFVRGSYLIFTISGSYVQGTSTKNTSYVMYGKIAGSSITHEHKLTGSSLALCSGVSTYGGNDLIFVYSGSFNRLEISGGEVVMATSVAQSVGYITQNGKYANYNAQLYKINQQTGTCSLIKNAVGSATAIDETGEYYLYSGQVYNLAGTKLGAVQGLHGSQYFKIVDDSYIDSSHYTTTLVPSEGAQYTIAHASNTSVAGNIYGVVSEEMTMGEIKYAQKLFNA